MQAARPRQTLRNKCEGFELLARDGKDHAIILHLQRLLAVADATIDTMEPVIS